MILLSNALLKTENNLIQIIFIISDEAACEIMGRISNTVEKLKQTSSCLLISSSNNNIDGLFNYHIHLSSNKI